ncbi:ABC transporter permease subunit [Actinoplanes sp. CA-142083]|uniref:ABC transporter permease subunit n=1 Tax=Actinoplanes sp. CA-142083 TaxID=3239903 RepID=UPI003D8DEEB4
MNAVTAEWGKIWSLRSPWFCAVAAVLLTAGMAATLANDFLYDIDQGRLPESESLAVLAPLTQATQVGQFALVALAMLVVTSEYGTGVIRSTLLARPRRGDVLLAKTAVAAVVGFVAGLASAAAGWAVTALLLGDHAGTGEPVTACLRLAVVAMLACMFTVAVGFLVRSAAGTLTTMFVLLVGLLLVDARIGRYLPAGAADAFAAGDGVRNLGILVAWTGAAQLAAWLLLARRDA